MELVWKRHGARRVTRMGTVLVTRGSWINAPTVRA